MGWQTGGTDSDAIHDNVSGEIQAVTEKTTPADADLVIIEDSAASYVKKKVQVVNLPGGGGGGLWTALPDPALTALSCRSACCAGRYRWIPTDGGGSPHGRPRPVDGIRRAI